MIISKKKFNEAVEKAVNEAVVKARKEDWTRKQRQNVNDNMWIDIDENRKNLLAVTKELNDIIAYLCDKDPEFARKKVEEIKNKSSIYKRMNAPRYIEPCDPADEF